MNFSSCPICQRVQSYLEVAACKLGKSGFTLYVDSGLCGTPGNYRAPQGVDRLIGSGKRLLRLEADGLL